MSEQQKIIVGMSGGVDSSVSALLLKQQGYDVEGLFMKNWEEDDTDTYCAANQDVADAQAVCDKLNIKLHRVNFSSEYWDHVFEHFLTEYRAGRTPNPDILCNKWIKFKAFLDYAQHLGANKIATGHYAQIKQNNGKYQLVKGADQNKDQSYFLYTLAQNQLASSLFPIGKLEKPQVRKLAKEAGLINHSKKDSTGICFIGERKFKDFLSRYIPHKPGDIETSDGKTMGQHDGLMYYTIGQRQGLGIGGLKNGSEEPWYVIAKDLKRNVLIVAQGHNHPSLFSKGLICDQLTWISEIAPDLPLKCQAKVRYRQETQKCLVARLNDEQLEVIFEEAQRAITPGQSVVFYDNAICLGGGIINEE